MCESFHTAVKRDDSVTNAVKDWDHIKSSEKVRRKESNSGYVFESSCSHMRQRRVTSWSSNENILQCLKKKNGIC